MADWLGLRTFAVAQIAIAPDDEIALGHDRSAEEGTAIAIRAESGAPWGGTGEELRALVDPTELSRLVVLDTWLLNCDRYPPDLTKRRPNHNNVFLSAEASPPGKFLLTAMDHTHCFTCGRELNATLSQIDRVKDPRVFGRFPQFNEFLRREKVEDAAARLSGLPRSVVETAVVEIPADWQLSNDARARLCDLVCDRADFVGRTIVESMFPESDGQ